MTIREAPRGRPRRAAHGASPHHGRRVLMKGNEAIAEAAIQAGCDAYFGYPITPQAELLEWMARRMPEEGRRLRPGGERAGRDQHGASARPRPARASSSARPRRGSASWPRR